MPAGLQPGPPSEDVRAAADPANVEPAQPPPPLLLLLLATSAGCSCTFCWSEGVGGRTEVGSYKESNSQNQLSQCGFK
jgi:hypothetical protein